MSNYKNVLYENWERVLNEYYNQGLIQEANPSNEGLSDTWNKTKDFLKKNTSVGQAIDRYQKNKEFDKKDKQQGTGKYSGVGNRLISTGFDVLHGAARLINGENPFNFEATDGSYFEKPKNHSQEVDNTRSEIQGMVNKMLTILGMIEITPRILDMVAPQRAGYFKRRTEDNNRGFQLLPTNLNLTSQGYFDRSNTDKIKVLIYNSGAINNDKKTSNFKNFDWLHMVVSKSIKDDGRIINNYVNTYIKNLNYRLGLIDKEINEYIVHNMPTARSLDTYKSDPFIQQKLNEKKNIVSSTLTATANSILKQLKTELAGRKRTKDILPYLFDTNKLQALATTRLNANIDICNKKIDNTFILKPKPKKAKKS